MINVQLPTFVGKRQMVLPVRRISPQLFWLLFAVEALVVFGLLFVVLHLLLPVQSPLSASADYATVREAAWSRLNGTVPDPLIDVLPGVSARASSVRGFTLNGRTYFYYTEGQRGFDPLSRGAVDRSEIEIVLRDDGGPMPLVIYRLKGKDRAIN
jgi:hypothetical protein